MCKVAFARTRPVEKGPQKKYIRCVVNKKTGTSYFLYDNDEEDSRGTRPIEKFLVRYREHGDYSIDNSATERAIRPITVSRNGSMFFSSEGGVTLAMGFHSLIETGKNRARNLKNWIASMLRELLHGNTDYEGILQGAYITA